MRNACNILVEKRDEDTSWKYRFRCEDNIKMDLKEIYHIRLWIGFTLLQIRTSSSCGHANESSGLKKKARHSWLTRFLLAFIEGSTIHATSGSLLRWSHDNANLFHGFEVSARHNFFTVEYRAEILISLNTKSCHWVSSHALRKIWRSWKNNTK
jgi:hypothetical protein